MAARSEIDTRDDDFAPPPSPADEAGPGPIGGLNVLSVVTGRWPLVVVGLMVGLALAGLFHIQRQPRYESRAQVLVIKQSSDAGKSADGRSAFLEDIVSTQVTLLRSERILVATAKKLNPADLNFPLPESERDRAAVFAGGLTVSRDKDSSPSLAGSGILNLTYRATDPTGAKLVLEAVIKTYQQELSSIYDDATRTQLKTLHDVTRALRAERETTLARRGERTDELRRITEEELPAVRNRASIQREKEISLEHEMVSLDKQIDLIAAAGVDRRKRLATLAQLSATLKPGMIDGRVDANNPEVQLRQLEAKRQERLDTLGRDHPEIKSMDAQIQFQRALFEKLNPAAAAGEETDELWAIEQRLLQQKSTVEDQLALTRARLRADRDTIVTAGRYQDEIELLTEQANTKEREINDKKKQLLEIEATQTAGGYQAQVITEPAGGYKVSPVLFQSIALGVVLGLLFGTGLAVASELTDAGFKSPAEVRRRLGLPVIGHLPRLNIEEAPEDTPFPGLDPKLVVVHKPKSVEAEAYRGVRTQLYFNTQGQGHQLIQVTSPNPGDGKSTLTANVACSIAQSGKKIILVDCDFRKPRVHKVFDLPKPDVGMASVVAGDARLDDAIQASAVPNLDILACGPRPANPAELLTSPGFVKVLEELRERYDYVMLDTPPMLAVSDPAVVAPRVDGVMLVIRMSNKARPAAERAREMLSAVGANVIGVCVNGVGGRANEGYGAYSYGYGYAYQYRYQYQYQYEYAEAYADADDDEETTETAVATRTKG